MSKQRQPSPAAKEIAQAKSARKQRRRDLQAKREAANRELIDATPAVFLTKTARRKYLDWERSLPNE